MKDAERGLPIENYGKKEQKEWLGNTLPDPHPCTAGNKEQEHTPRGKYVTTHCFIILQATLPKQWRHPRYHNCHNLMINLTIISSSVIAVYDFLDKQ